MPVPVKRFTSFNKDTEVASANLRKETADAVLNKPAPPTPTPERRAAASAATGKSLTPKIKRAVSDLPGQLAKVRNNNEAVDLLVTGATDKKGLSNALQEKTRQALYDRTVSVYNMFGGGGRPTEIRNKLKAGTLDGKYFVDSCLEDLASLIDMFNNLGGNLKNPIDKETIISFLLALLQKALCSGVDNVFGILENNLTSKEEKQSFASKSLQTASDANNSSLVKEISSSPVAGDLYSYNPGTPELALTSVKKYDASATKNADRDFLDMESSMVSLDPMWDTTGKKNGSRTTRKTDVGKMAHTYLKGTGDPSQAKLNTAIGLMNVNTDPFESILSPT